MAEFISHFKKFPRIGKPNLALILKFPLGRSIMEPSQYEVYKPEGYGRNVDTLEGLKNSIFEGQDSASLTTNFFPINKSGFLHKRGHVRKNWKKRWFVLDRGELSYYSGTPTTPQQAHNKLIRKLDLGQVLWLDEKEHTFKQKYCFTLYFPGIKYSMYAFEEEDYEAWISILKQALKLPRHNESTS
ncbi:Dual adapter for phosphotyrosine and 3-phosphotyrosine and 3-phosphoinositide-like [Oopsacas minuta]|uniref:Dual adapter for phosphotyrosine and 3-phosphotyrosine and 3-phosphoinositide-like n=1 Tax=Oopsacas minuta TaxID=111878 RepID=A0AAV7KC74_9METZ|nr:Dual adapter for phosphotyrosine and 3-phosphotyrosine and 3-phosphoinositide-like [Oopsacas minuta]